MTIMAPEAVGESLDRLDVSTRVSAVSHFGSAGRLVWEERLKGPGRTGQNWSSVMLANGLCYTITQGGDCFVFKASPTFELVAVNPLGERSNSSIVPSDGELFIRTHQALWCIAAK